MCRYAAPECNLRSCRRGDPGAGGGHEWPEGMTLEGFRSVSSWPYVPVAPVGAQSVSRWPDAHVAEATIRPGFGGNDLAVAYPSVCVFESGRQRKRHLADRARLTVGARPPRRIHRHASLRSATTPPPTCYHVSFYVYGVMYLSRLCIVILGWGRYPHPKCMSNKNTQTHNHKPCICKRKRRGEKRITCQRQMAHKYVYKMSRRYLQKCLRYDINHVKTDTFHLISGLYLHFPNFIFSRFWRFKKCDRAIFSRSLRNCVLKHASQL